MDAGFFRQNLDPQSIQKLCINYSEQIRRQSGVYLLWLVIRRVKLRKQEFHICDDVFRFKIDL